MQRHSVVLVTQRMALTSVLQEESQSLPDSSDTVSECQAGSLPGWQHASQEQQVQK